MAPKKGNTNALKHGIYSKHISVQDDVELKGMSSNNPVDELAITRVQIRQILDKEVDVRTMDDWIKLKALTLSAIGEAAGMVHANAILGKNSSQAFKTICEMISVVNKEQHVK